jgi:stage II sporulation protein M
MLFWGNDQILWLAVIGVTILAALLVRVGIAHFQREALLGHEIDVLNLRWLGRTFWRYFRSGASNPWSWFRQGVFPTVRKLTASLGIMLVLGGLGLVLGYSWVVANSQDILKALPSGELAGLFAAGMPELSVSFLFIWVHNLRAILIILLLGLFSFGVLGVLLFLVNMGVIGAVLGLFSVRGVPPLQLSLYGILPHGIFELTALVLASAAILHIGLVLVTPRPQNSLGEVLIETVADWAKVGAGLVLPLLTIAAAVEAWVTPVLLSKLVLPG